MSARRGAIRRTAAAMAGLMAFLVVLPALAGTRSGTAPPPTPVPVPPNGSPSPSPFPAVLHTPAPSAAAPAIGAAAAVLEDLDTGQLLFAKNPDARRPIASLTKIMTALLVLERTRPTDLVTVGADALAPASAIGLAELGLQAGEEIAVGELLYALLLQSANDAAIALAEHLSGTVDAFVSAMNARAARLGLRNTMFRSPSGLDDDGFSSARDLATLTRAAYRLPGFARIVRTKFHDVPSPTGPDRHIQNRNVLLWLYPGAIGVKTGFTTAAGLCVVATAQREGLRLVAVVLGDRAEPFSEAASLLNYGFAGFEHRVLVQDREVFGPIPIDGHPVPVVANGGLSGLVPVGAASSLSQRVRAIPGVLYPPASGERVGAVTVSVPGLRIGSVPLVVASVPPPPPPPAGPWWRRAFAAVVRAASGVLHALLN